MTDKQAQALSALLASKKYGELCEATVRRTFEDALSRHKRLKDVDKAARSQLHQIAGAFMTEAELKSARKCLTAYLDGDMGALRKALSMHASTRERLDSIDALYDKVFEITGSPGRILDLACGLNPIYLGSRGLSVAGWDIHGGAVALVNEWGQAADMDIRAEVKDVLSTETTGAWDLALFMKLLPVLDSQETGGALRALHGVAAKHKLVTFPTRTLSGRGVGMEKHYSEWLESRIAPEKIAARFTVPGELCYILQED